jgi:hypothetical protein
VTHKVVTIKDLVSWTLLNENQIHAAIGDRSEFDAADVLRLDISSQEKLRIVLRTRLLDNRTLRLFACNCVEHVLPIFERNYPDDNRPRSILKVVQRFADGRATEDDLAVAQTSALNVSRELTWMVNYNVVIAVARAANVDADYDPHSCFMAAAHAVAQAAAHASGGNAYRDTDWDIAKNAAESASDSRDWFITRNAACDAASDAAQDAERDWQIQNLIKLINENILEPA